MAKPLVIVESPAKARTIAGFLGGDFVVESSIGHIRDLPKNSSEIPANVKGEPWARLGVNVEEGFRPLYVISSEKKPHVSKLKKLVSEASELYLATDEDREGESIAWHLLEVLSPRIPVKRMVFHEITKTAIDHAIQNSRDIDRRLVDAQEARRILDRLYGFEVSPVLWRKVMPRLSAGRVQSVATRIIVERERARMRHRAAEWWDILGGFSSSGTDFKASISSIGGVRVASGKDFDETGNLPGSSDGGRNVVLLSEGAAGNLASALREETFKVASIEEKPFKRSPYAPFATSTLQQEAGRKLRFSSARTMQVAQRLYENGYITYMRTDSTTLSDQALNAAREQVRSLYGSDYLPDGPRRYDRKVKNAQEAHEAIRPAGERFRTPEQLSSALNADELKLYDLIWKRTVASQMKDATGTTAQVRLSASVSESQSVSSEIGGSGFERTEVVFSTSGKVITFPGFLRAYVEGADDPEAELEDQETRLPPMREGQELSPNYMTPQGHTTQPPSRYTEASLVKALEDMGVGRPSTYASIISTIQDRGYVRKKGTALVPTFVAFAVVGLLEKYFNRLVDYGFTASMEDDLDDIAGGREEEIPWLTRFYFGEPAGDKIGSGSSNGNGEDVPAADGANGGPPVSHSHISLAEGLKRMVADHLDDIDAREVNSIVIGQDESGSDIVVRVGRYGPYIDKDGERASLPEDMCPDEVTPETVDSLLRASSSERRLGDDPETGLPVLVLNGRFGPYVQLGETNQGLETEEAQGEKAQGEKAPKAKKAPDLKRASLFKSMTMESIELEDAIKLLNLPRVVGSDPSDGEEIKAQNGRFGPYLTKGTDTRSLTTEDEIFSVTLEQAVAIFAQPKTRRGRTAQAPLKELGPHPDSGKPIVVKDGRFGPYVTDGEINASLSRSDSLEELGIERALELLEARRVRMAEQPPRGRGVKKSAAKKAPAKKSAAKKSAPAKKAGAKKAASAKKPAAKKVAKVQASVEQEPSLASSPGNGAVTPSSSTSFTSE